MKDNALLEAVGQLKTDVGNVAKLALPRAEAEERFKKISADFEEVQKALKEQKIRLSAQPGEDVVGGGGYWLGKNGYPTCKAATQLQVFDRHPITGQVTDRKMVPDDVFHAIKTMDDVYMVHHLMFRKYGDAWLDRLKDGGVRCVAKEREVFMKEFPELGNRHDATIKALARSLGMNLEEYLKVKTVTTGGTATGAEWIPNTFSSALLDIIREANPETNLIPHMNQPANPWLFPLLNPVGVAYRKVENVNVTESTPGTANKTWTAHVHAVYHSYTDEMSEDSIVAVVPALRFSLIRAMGEGIGMAIVNGDNDAASHIDDDYQQATAPYFTYQGGINGLRQFALDAQGTGTALSVDGGANGLAFADVGAALATMGKFAASGRTTDIVLLTNNESWLSILTEASSPIVTVDKYGGQATILTGEVGRIYGVPVMVSYGVEQRRNAVASTGVAAGGSGDTLSTAVMFNRMNFRIGDRRDFRFETDRNIIAMRNDIVSSLRMSMNAVEGDVTDANWDPSGTPAVCVIRNIN